MKRLLAFFLVLTMLFSVATLFAGCEEDSPKKSSSSKNEDEEEEETEDSKQNEDPTDPTEDPTDPADDPTDPKPAEPTDPKPAEPTDPGEYEFDDTDGNGPLLYKVTDDEGNVIWLFGSIHVGREDYYPLPDYVMDAFEGSDALAVEADIVAFEGDQAAQTQALMMMMYTDGTMISDHLSEEVYDAAVELMSEYGQYNVLLDYFLPILWYQTISSLAVEEAGGDVSLGIDRYFIGQASSTGMEILEVESAEFQYGMLAGFSEELQIYLLESALESFENLSEMEQDLKVMMDLWQSGNEAAFAQYLADESDVDPEYEALWTEYNNAMIVERNETMTEYAIETLESGKEVFICVGAAHIVGEDAMADNLRELGYTVEIVR